MLLFYPFREEKNEVHDNPNIVQKYNRLKDIVNTNQKEFEPNPDFMSILENVDAHDIISQCIDEQEYVEEETTTAEEIENFMQNQSTIYDGGKIRLEEKRCLNQRINTLNVEKRKIFDELIDLKEDKQFFLYLYGQDGTGKSYLINTLIPALEFKAFKS